MGINPNKLKKILSNIKGVGFKLCMRSDIDINDTRCLRTSVSIMEGYGGRPIDEFPPFSFLSLYLNGDKKGAKKVYADWYYDQFIKKKYYQLPKNKGGFLNGTLYNKVWLLHSNNGIAIKENLQNLNEQLLWQAIEDLVDMRFLLCNEIAEKGYKSEPNNNIILTFRNGLYHLTGGHHRTCILKILGYKTIPKSVVIPHFLYKPLLNIYQTINLRIN